MRLAQRLAALSAALIAAAWCGAGCSPPTAPGGDAQTPAPSVPSTLAFDGGARFAALAASANALPSPGGILGETGDSEIARPCSSFVRAAAQVGVWSVAAGASLAVPVALTAAAMRTEPSYTRSRTDGETYTWTVTATVPDSAGVTRSYGATLIARIAAGWVHWSMTVSGQLPLSPAASVTLDHFAWYEGEMPLAATSGWWQFYDPRAPSSAMPSMRVTWSRTPGTLSVGYLEQRAGAAVGDSLRYTLAGSTATFDMWTAAAASRALVVADTSDWAGSLTRAPGDVTCWDGFGSLFACVTCPAGAARAGSAANAQRRGSMRNSR